MGKQDTSSEDERAIVCYRNWLKFNKILTKKDFNKQMETYFEGKIEKFKIERQKKLQNTQSEGTKEKGIDTISIAVFPPLLTGEELVQGTHDNDSMRWFRSPLITSPNCKARLSHYKEILFQPHITGPSPVQIAADALGYVITDDEAEYIRETNPNDTTEEDSRNDSTHNNILSPRSFS
eukprot:GHVP01047990.1.p1 GENE.GHVP01047990.1~~GHVP01047990.1.p1  ORF type:complete len:179 (+),score=19.69 GHVP01047990.1:96-632(+)